jgi:alkaline phosphatase D
MVWKIFHLYLMHRLLLFIFITMCSITLSAQTHYPDRIYADTAYAPFYYGVASGDPTQHEVILWTKLYMPDSLGPRPSIEYGGLAHSRWLKWAVANDSLFHDIISAGTSTTDRGLDYTVRALATGLQPGHQYYYRFYTMGGTHSQTGLCRTLPDDSVKHIKFALVSCSSVWSGYFNAYRRIAERSDIDYVIHVGDYIYDFVDNEEERRMPVPYPTEPDSLPEWRARHTYYLLDPDLREARRTKTWIVEWDNHDTHYKKHGWSDGGIEAFYEYMPMYMPNPKHPERIYREFHFGTLADLDMIDMYLFRGKEEFEPGHKSILGNEQDAWLKDKLRSSRATWHLLGNQEMMGSWLSQGLPHFLHLPGNGKYFDPGDWDGYPEDRGRLFDFIDSAHIKNLVTLSGDLHMSFALDLTRDPQNKTSYNKHTGRGSVGVELLGPSISRGNMSDRAVVPKGTIPLVQSISKSVNPHHVWVNFAKHGYCTLDVTPERCVGEFWYSDILKQTDNETFGAGLTVRDGANHWERKVNKNRKKSTRP